MDFIQEQTNERTISSEVIFYNIAQLTEMLGWGENTVKKMFNDPKFPAADFGHTKVVEAHALIEYFSVRHTKKYDKHWNGKGKTNARNIR
jgi:hypothetical protein